MSRRILALSLASLAVMMLAVGSVSADNRQVLPFPSPWQSQLHRDHPLAGRIWSKAAGGLVSTQEYGSSLANARFVLLGEVHDNPDHHALQAWAISTIAKLRGARIVEGAPQMDIMAMEMLTPGEDEALDRFYGRNAKVPRRRTAKDFGRMMRWDKLGWPDFSMYEPIVAAALNSHLVIRAASPTRELGRKVAADGFGALGDGVAERLKLTTPLAAPLDAALGDDIREGHCGLLPEGGIPAMVRVQRLRDATMAETMLSVGDWKGAILIAGNGHVRRDRGAPWYLAERSIDPAKMIAVEHVEVREGEIEPAGYIPRAPDGAPAADFVVFTPAVSRPDPCEGMRRHFEAKQPPQPSQQKGTP